MVDLLLPRQTPLPSRQRLEEKVVADHVNFTLTLCAPSTEMRIGLLCANSPICGIDPLGLDVWVFDSGGGHAYIVVTNPNSPTGYTQAGYYEPGVNWDHNSSGAFYGPGKNDVTPSPLPPGGTQIHTTPAQDAAILAKAQAVAKDPGSYRVWGNNCANIARQEVQAGVPGFPGTWFYDSPDSLAAAAKKFGTPGGSGSGCVDSPPSSSSSDSSGSSSGSSGSSSSDPNPGVD